MRRALTMLGLLIALAASAVIPSSVAQFSPNPFAPTYSAGEERVSAAAPTDIFCVEGPTSGSGRILNVTVYLNLGTTGTSAIWIKRSTLNTGGTSFAATPAKRDSNISAASTMTLRMYTVNPTSLGVEQGRLQRLPLQRIVGDFKAYAFDWATLPIVLNGPNEALCLNGEGGALGATFIIVSIIVQQGN